MKAYGVGITGVSHKLASKIQTNEELCALLPDTTPEWIISKTGIKKRYHVTEDETASSLSIDACKDLLAKTGIAAADIGLIIVASFSQDYLFPPLSARIHNELGASKRCQIMDINTNCTGLVTALTTGVERMLSDDTIRHTLVIGVEILSRYTRPNDPDTAIFFSDGASAVLLSHVEQGSGYIASSFLTDSSTYESVRMRGGGSSFPVTKENPGNALSIEQNGLATWKQAVTNLPVTIQALLTKTALKVTDIDFVIFHQANHFLINYIMQKMKIPAVKTYMNVEEYGNTGSASIGIALSEAYAKGLIKKDDKVIIAGVGAGFNFGACLFVF